MTEQKRDLIPANNAYDTYDYYCTWRWQGRLGKILGLHGERGAPTRDTLTDERLFGKDNLFHKFDPALRQDLILLIDDGWDVPLGTRRIPEETAQFGACDPDGVKFPGYGDTPTERLTTLRKKAEAMGYKGLGLWLASQIPYRPERVMERDRPVWEEHARWCHEAGVRYWKIDWGYHTNADGYRRMITEAAAKCAPGLTVEHVVALAPFTMVSPLGVEAELKKQRTRIQKQTAFSAVHRVHDVERPLCEVVVLDRVAAALTTRPRPVTDTRGLINVEDMAYIGAVLGCPIGFMDHESHEEDAAIRWHRVAPPFGIHETDGYVSDERLEDSYYFTNKPGGWVRSCQGKTLYENAPAVIARNCQPPTVTPCGGLTPYVAAAKNPLTGAYSLGAFRRTVDPNRQMNAPADITWEIDDVSAPIGLFGVFGSVTLVTRTPIPAGCRVYAQDMADTVCTEVTEQVAIEGDRVILDGKLLRLWGMTSRENDDASQPAVMLVFEW